MKANIRVLQRNDEGVSPVIAVILMVAITVVLAATVYVWVSGFASDSQGPEEASATAQGLDLDNDGDVEWVKLTLVRGENAPYDATNDFVYSIVNADGSSSSFVCRSADMTDPGGGTDSGDEVCADPFNGADTWSPGGALFIPCDEIGNMALSLAVRGTTILDSSVDCDEEQAELA